MCPLIFDETRTIQNNVAWVKYNGQWGVLNASILTGEEPDLEAIIADIEK
ncbi:MAG: WG repeat-containing protein [Lachnospira eligens]